MKATTFLPLLTGALILVFLPLAGCDEEEASDAPPPTVDFIADPLQGAAPLIVTFTDLSEGDYSKAVWNFGDGTESTHPQPLHLYEDEGTYTVELTLYRGDEIVATLARDAYISVGPPDPTPRADFTASPRSPSTGEVVQFMDASSGEVDAWSWNFGDGATSQLTNPTHTYNTAGMYTVTLTVSGSLGSDTEEKVNYISVTEPTSPTAYFTASPLSGPSPLTVQFTDGSTGSIDTWSWTFGDGSTGTDQNPGHTYTGNAGDLFTVSLTVSGPGGSDTYTRVNAIQITNGTAPIADFSATPTSGPSLLPVNFTDLSSGNITSWSWSFGDGSTGSARNPSHTYSGAVGTSFTVSLTVSGPGGSDTETKSGYIAIMGPTPVPCVPVIYLYPETPREEDVRVRFKGEATVTIPEVPLGREIVWEDCWADGMGVVWEGTRYDYLFYECTLDDPVTSHRGWILSRDAEGQLALNGLPITYEGLRTHFENELFEAGLYAHEVRDFLDCWLGPDAALFFGRETFTYAVKYFPIDQVDDTMQIVTSWKYDNAVRIQFYVEPAPAGLQLLEPVYPAAPDGGSVLHEWGVVPVSTLLER